MISGKMQSGKNTLANLIIDELTKSKIKVGYDFFAKPVKDQCKEIFRPLENYLNTLSTKYSIEELYTDDDNWYEDKNEITRILLQTYATEIFRNEVDVDYWAKLLVKNYKANINDVLCITDWRFRNEIEVVKKENINHITIRVNRPSVKRDSEKDKHQSEIDLDSYNMFDFEINNTDFDSLQNNAKLISNEIIKKINWHKS